jgi:hypothetical protein
VILDQLAVADDTERAVRDRYQQITGSQPKEADFWSLYAIASTGEDITPHVQAIAARNLADEQAEARVRWWWRELSGGQEVPDSHYWPLFALSQQGQDLEPHIKAALAGEAVNAAINTPALTVLNTPTPQAESSPTIVSPIEMGSADLVATATVDTGAIPWKVVLTLAALAAGWYWYNNR